MTDHLATLRAMRARALQGGGEERIAQQHARGKAEDQGCRSGGQEVSRHRASIVAAPRAVQRDRRAVPATVACLH